MDWQLKTFDELTARELHAIYKVRTDIFVVEQNCPYPEVDDLDLLALHLFLEKGGAIIAYCRLIETDGQIKLSRVLVVAETRQTGLGRQLVRKPLEISALLFPEKPIYVQAQAHLKDFYASFGFEAISEKYLEDGILHLDMLR